MGAITDPATLAACDFVRRHYAELGIMAPKQFSVEEQHALTVLTAYIRSDPAKLFIWREPFDGNYLGGIVFAVAPDAEAARKAVFSFKRENAGLGWKRGRLGQPDETHLGLLVAPFAESYEWSE